MKLKRKPKPPTQKGLESQLMRGALDLLARHPVHAMRMNAGAAMVKSGDRVRPLRFGEPGTPDLLVLLSAGRCFWIELKRPGGKLSPSQNEWIRREQLRGQHVYVCYSLQQVLECVQLELGSLRK